MFGDFDIFRHVSFGIKLQAQSHIRGGLLSDGMQMEVEADSCARFDQTGCAFRKNVAVLAQCVLVEEGSLRVDASVRWRIIVILHRRHCMVDHFETLDGLGFDGLDISILREMRVDLNIHPAVGSLCGHDDILR